MSENKEIEVTLRTPADWMQMAIEHKIGNQELWDHIDKSKEEKTVFDGKEWPTLFAITEEQRQTINEHVDAIFNVCMSGGIPITVVMQEMNMGGIGAYNVMNVIPRGRAGRKIMEVGNIVHAFIGEGTIDSQNRSLDYIVTRHIANLTALLWKAKNHEVPREEFHMQMELIVQAICNYAGELSNTLELSDPEPVPSENDEKEI